MFGHQNNQSQDTNDNQAQPPADFNPALPSTNTVVTSDVNPAQPTQDQPTETHHVAPAQTDGISANDLLDIKQKALGQLSPLVGHLEQTPEEKFRTTMMMIQASDNQDLIKDAYAAAEAITDEKAKAQALLDIVNEINYFTQHHQK